jgi:predicted  nucleic acid-binding Zn-ribbon protein
MKRAVVAVLSTMLLVFPSMAQHAGGHGQHGGGGGTPNGDAGADRQVVQDLHRAMEVQATDLQVAKFKSAAKSTEEALKKAQQFRQRANAENAEIKSLKDAVDQAAIENTEFIKSFSSAQKADLKELVKKLNKADAELSKLSKELNEARSANAGQRMSETLDRLDKVLSNFQKQQADLGVEMGIQG